MKKTLQTIAFATIAGAALLVATPAQAFFGPFGGWGPWDWFNDWDYPYYGYPYYGYPYWGYPYYGAWGYPYYGVPVYGYYPYTAPAVAAPATPTTSSKSK